MIIYKCGPYNPRDQKSLEKSFRYIDETVRTWAEEIYIDWTEEGSIEHYLYFIFTDEGWTGYVLSYPMWKYDFRKYIKVDAVLESAETLPRISVENSSGPEGRNFLCHGDDVVVQK